MAGKQSELRANTSSIANLTRDLDSYYFYKSPSTAVVNLTQHLDSYYHYKSPSYYGADEIKTGVTVAVVAGVIVILIAICVCCCLRRRKLHQEEAAAEAAARAEDEAAHSLLQNEQRLFQQVADTSPEIFSTAPANSVLAQFADPQSRKDQRERYRSDEGTSGAFASTVVAFSGTWTGFECRNTSGDPLEKISIRLSGRRVLSPPRSDSGATATCTISGEMHAQNNSVEFEKQTGVTRATVAYTGQLEAQQQIVTGQWRGHGTRGIFTLWPQQRFQDIQGAVRLLVNLGHTFTDVGLQSAALGPSSLVAINKLISDRRERGERFPELDEIIRDIS